jgi:hypothetical protein
VSYTVKENVFEIRWKESGKLKKVTRANLFFELENREKYMLQ